MKIHGYKVPEDALRDARKAMVGVFTCTSVSRAVVPHLPEARELPGGWERESFALEVCNRLFQSEKRKGRAVYDRSAMVWRRVQERDQ